MSRAPKTLLTERHEDPHPVVSPGLPLQRIALVRHGETDWNAQNRFIGQINRELTAIGDAQAARAGALLREWDWDRIVSSPLARAHRTATLIATSLGMDGVSVMQDLTERHFGVAEEMDRDEASARWPDLSFPGGEPVAEVGARALRAWDAIIADAMSTVVVTHVVVIRAIVDAITGIDPGFVPNGSLIVLTRQGSSWELEGEGFSTRVPR